MSRCVIKKAVVAASLGLAMFVTSPALAVDGSDELVVICLAVSDVKLVVKGAYSATKVEEHPELNNGFGCMETLKFLKKEGFVKSKEAYFAGVAVVSMEFPVEAMTTGGVEARQTNQPSVPLAVVIRFTCTDLGTCLD